MLKDFIFDLQLFADGGDGGSGGEGAAGTSGVSGDFEAENAVEIPSFVPERAKKNYLKAVQKTRSVSKDAIKESKHPLESASGDPTATKNEEPAKKLSYSEIIKSDEYKADHEAYMRSTIGDRLKKYKGMADENASAKELLSSMAERLGVSPDSPTFFEDLKKAASKDESAKRVREYMSDHDVDEEEAQRIVDMETQIREKKNREEAEEKAKAEYQRQKQQEELRNNLLASAEKTRAMYPGFHLDENLKDERFLRICAVTGGDTTAAYMATHHGEILQSTAAAAAQKANLQLSNAVAANKRRPSENGLQSAPSSVAETDFSRMNRKELRQYWADYRKTRR